MFHRRAFLLQSFGAAIGRAATKAPNIIVILTDDQGFGDLGCNGASDLRTPNLDRLAAGGIRFTDWHANSPVCSPSRASVVTGKYPQRTGIAQVLNSKPTFDVAGLRKGENSLARSLQQAGYRTGIVGKWHLGSTPESRPAAQGFEYFYGFYSGWTDSYSQRYYTLGGNPGAAGPPPQNIFHDWWENDQEIFVDGQYQTELLGAKAVAFVEQKRGQPFFLFLTFGAPHYPMMAPARYLERFPSSMDRDRRMHAAMIAAVDDAVGGLAAALRRQGLLDNTVLFFMGDNGATEETRGDHRGRVYRGGSNGPFRGWKGGLWEGGHRVPAFVHWPAKLRPRVESRTGMGMDLLPTLLAAASPAAESGPPNGKIDGTNLLPAWTGSGPWPERTLYWEYDKQWAVRKGKWKLLVDPRPSLVFPNEKLTWLSNLEEDPEEKTNYAERAPEVVRELRELLAAWRW